MPGLHRFLILPLLVFLAAVVQADDDPLQPVFAPVLRPTLDVMLETCVEGRRYTNTDFPMQPETFAGFRADLTRELEQTLNLQDWAVRKPVGRDSPIADRFHCDVLASRELHGISLELLTVMLEPGGLTVPMVICLPDSVDPRPAVCCFSGHTKHGLRDLVVDLDSYQQGIAVRLARAGFVAIAVEKIDTGYLSRQGMDGVDEKELATLLLGWNSILRSEQLKACLAAVEIAAAHERVDPQNLGVTGVSLGGWLSVQTALLNDRITAVADFGRKTRGILPGIDPRRYQGQVDLCHIIPGLLTVCDRNLHCVALAPTPMLAGHGKQDSGSHQEAHEHFRHIGEAQYEALGEAANYTYLIHDGGDTMPSDEVIEWFADVFEQ